MTIAYITSAFAESTTLTMPTHQAGDLLVIVAFRPSSNALVAVPSDWTVVGNVSMSSFTGTIVVAYRIADGSSETSGTWTSASMLCCAVYRDANLHALVSGYYNRSASTTTISYPARFAISTALGGLDAVISMPNASAVVLAIAVSPTKSSGLDAAPTGMTNRVFHQGASVGSIAIHDSDTAIASWATTTVTVGSAIAYATAVVPFADLGFAYSSGGTARPSHPMYEQVIG